MKTNEIAESMASLLDPEFVKQSSKNDNVKSALDSLNKAAELLDHMGLYIVAEAVTDVMEQIPTQIAESKKETGE